MNIVVEKEKMKFCPLCRRKWIIVEDRDPQGRAYFMCRWCKIWCWVRDIFVGRWEQLRHEQSVHCPNCRNHSMNFFCRMDGYMKYHCMNCEAEIETLDENRHGKIIAPDSPGYHRITGLGGFDEDLK